MDDEDEERAGPAPFLNEVDDTPTVSCDRCGDEWDLSYELDELKVGNQAIEQFALDHKRHTGHFPDDITPWVVTCRQCPASEEFLAESPAETWARVHARHTTHAVEVVYGNEEPSVVDQS